MAGIAVGVDFGTSNTAAATPGDGTRAQILVVDPLGDEAELFRSVLFFPEDSAGYYAGSEAITRYLDEGEGRFLQSVKSFLPSTSFRRTEIRRRSYKLEELVSLLLVRLRVQIEKQTGSTIERLVLGRPAVFHAEPERDRLAEERLCAAAELAGFPKPTFMIEPIAAALRYEETLDHDEVVLVGDFGAGTSDFTLMKLGPGRGDGDRRRDVLASSGVRIGGDRFDAAIVESRLLRRFGAGTSYKTLTSRVELPTWMTRTLLAWHELFLLREKSNMDFLHNALKSSDRPRDLQNLVTLVEENLAYSLYRSVEAAKRELSRAEEATLSFEGGDIVITERITRADFERWTAPLRAELMRTVDRVMALAPGISPDAVFLTGGSSRIPSVRAEFATRFGEAHLREGDSFTAVAAGLGRAAGLAGLGSRWDGA